MNVVDSSGWIEYFNGGENEAFFAPVIEDITQVIVPTISLFEVFKRILQQSGKEYALEAVAIMQEAQVVDLDSATALVAAELSNDYKLPLADSIILATARANSATLWTQDEHFDGLPGVRYVKKRDSR